MSIILSFKFYQTKFKKKPKKTNKLGCDIIIFPGIRYSTEKNPVFNDKIVAKTRKAVSSKRSGVVNKRGS